MKTMLKGLLLAAALLMVAARPAAAQSGFTVLGNVGFGLQHDTDFAETANGLAGPNIGAGVFLTPKIAVLGRMSGTMATFTGNVKQNAYVYGGTIQFWLNKWASVEAGAGYGHWTLPDFNESGNGFGLLFAFEATVWQKGPHHIRAGFEYAPLFDTTNNFDIHNMGIVGGYQWVKK